MLQTPFPMLDTFNACRARTVRRLSASGCRAFVKILASLLVVALAGGVIRGAEQIYTCQVLETVPPIDFMRILRINNAGVVIGSCKGVTPDSENGLPGTRTEVDFGFIWTEGRTTILDPSSPRGNWARAINDSGLVVGTAHPTRSTGIYLEAFKFENGVFTALPEWGPQVDLAAVNSSGIIAGTYGLNRAVRFVNGDMEHLGTLGGGFSSATAINDAGAIVGQSANSAGIARGFVWRDGTMRELGTLGASDSPVSINESGVIVGTSYTSEGHARAVRFESDRVFFLDPPGFRAGMAYDVNESDEIVGVRMNPEGDRAIVIRDGTVWELSRWLERSGFTSGCATGINDRGQIVGYGMRNGEQKAFLLTPLRPEPPSLPLYSFCHRMEGGEDGALFSNVADVAVDRDGNVFVADDASWMVRKVAPDGRVTSLAGLDRVRGTSDGVGYHARFVGPRALTVDAMGTVYVADSGNDEWYEGWAMVRKISSDGYVTTLAGSRVGYVDGAGEVAQFGEIMGIAVDNAGDVFVADGGNRVIRRITPDGMVSTFAGRVGERGSEDGGPGVALFDELRRMAIDSAGNLYVCDRVNRLRKVTPGGVVSTIVLKPSETSFPAQTYVTDGGIAVDSGGTIFLADDFFHRIYTVSAAGVVSTFAGGPESYWNSASYDGIGDEAGFQQTLGISLDRQGQVYVADGSCVRKIAPDRAVTTLAGATTRRGSMDGLGSRHSIKQPTGIAPDKVGGVYVLDRKQHALFRFAPDGAFSVVAGKPGEPGNRDGVGVGARFREPLFVAAAAAGGALLAEDTVIRRIAVDGTVTTLAGRPGSSESRDGTGGDAEFTRITGMVCDANDVLYVSDNCTIRRISEAGVVTTLAGLFGAADRIDGQGGSARFEKPSELALGHGGDLFVVDGVHIRRVTTAGLVSTVAGTGEYIPGDAYGPTRDGPGWAASFNGPGCMVADAQGNILLSDGSRIRLLDAAMNVWTIVGPPAGEPMGFVADGVGHEGNLGILGASALAVGADGQLLVGDTTSACIRVGIPVQSGVPTITEDPDDANVRAEEGTATFRISASGIGMTYRWQRLPFGRSGSSMLWTDLSDDARISGVDSTELTIKRVPITMWGDQFRCVVTNASGFNVSGSATLQVVEPHLEIMKQPADATTTDGFTTSFFLLPRSRPWSITYRWQLSADGGSTWADANEGATFWNVSTKELGVRATLDMHGWQFRCIVNNGWADEVTSSPATVSVLPGSQYSFSTLAWMMEWSSGSGREVWSSGMKHVAVGDDGTVYVAHGALPIVYKIEPRGDVQVVRSSEWSPLVPTPPASPVVLAGGRSGSADGVGAAAEFGHLTGIAVDHTGCILLVDNGNSTVRRITPSGVVSTIAGVARRHGFADGPVAQSRFNYPSGIAVGPDGTIFVGDPGNHVVRAITSSGEVTTVAGTVGQAGYRDGPAETALFASPSGVGCDGEGNLFVLDDHVVRKISRAGEVTTVAGTYGLGAEMILEDYSEREQIAPFDGIGGGARLPETRTIAVDRTGNVFFTDLLDDTLRRISPEGVVTTIAGAFDQYAQGIGDYRGRGWYSDGVGPEARFCGPFALDVDRQGNLLCVSVYDGAIRIGRPVGIHVRRSPDNRTARSFETVDFQVEATGPGALIYRWQRRLSERLGWVDLVESPSYSGTSTATLRVADVRLEMDRQRFRCIVSDGKHADEFSAPATLHVEPIRVDVVLSNLRQAYTGSPRPVSIAINPELPATVRYDDGPTVPSAVGAYRVTATVREGEYFGQADATLEIIPSFLAEPVDETSVVAGGPVRLSGLAHAGVDVHYQWQFRAEGSGAWADIPKATLSEWVLPSAQMFHSGSYRLVAHANGVSAVSGESVVGIKSDATSAARLLNLSTRALCLTDDDVLIPGFYIQGAGTKRLLMRAVGPELAKFGVSGTLADPQIVLKRQSDGEVLATNDNWGDNANWEEIRDTARAIYAFSLTEGSKSAALLTDLPAGGYTIVASGHGEETGVSIVELYEVQGTDDVARLVNISNRGYVGVGGDIMIPGFVVSNEGSRTFLIRAVGPSLARFNVSGVLADPMIEVYKRRPGTAIDDLILTNDTWGENGDADQIRTTAAALHAFKLNEGSTDAAFVVTLPPGAYTVNAKGKDGATGVAIVEVYLVP